MPGGAYSRNELADWATRDPVVRQHYDGFRITSASLVTAQQDLFVYVSYRRNNEVLWTSRKLRVPKGEILWSDGEHLARARCGNRLAQTPPPNAHHAPLEPPGLDLPPFSMPLYRRGLVPSAEAPELPPPPVIGTLGDVQPVYQPSWTAAPPSPPVDVAATPVWPASPFPAPPGIVSLGAPPETSPGCCSSAQPPGGGGQTPVPTPVPTPVSTPAPSPVPEPAYLALSGLILLLPLWVRRVRTR